MGRHKAKMKQEPIKIELPDADVFLKNKNTSRRTCKKCAR